MESVESAGMRHSSALWSCAISPEQPLGVVDQNALAPAVSNQDVEVSLVARSGCRDFDALEIHPCMVVGHDSMGGQIVEQCEPKDAQFWTVYGHFRTGGVDAFEDFATEAEAIAFHDRLVAIYPHLAAREG